MKTELYYIHGFRSHPDQSNPKTEFLKEFCNQRGYEFIAPRMEWETRGCDILEQLVDSFRFVDRQDSILRQSRRRIFVGTSLGGAGALRLFRDFNRNHSQCFIINPVLNYHHSSFYDLEQSLIFNGENEATELYNFHTGIDSAITLDHLTDIRLMIARNQNAMIYNEINEYRYNMRMFIGLIGLNDDILNPKIAERFSDLYRIPTSYSRGTHSFSDDASMFQLKHYLNFYI